MIEPAISILIPVYNTEKYLRDCLESVVNQTIDSKEIIILDDGSTDLSSTIIDEYAEKYECVTAIHQENRGLWEARCKLFSVAKGHYIAWVDSDDFVEKEMYKTLYDVAIQNNADLVICDYDFYPNEIKTKLKWYKPYKGVVDWSFIERNTQPWNKIVRRDLLESIEFGKWLSVGGDGFYSLVLIKSQGVVSVDEELYHYRVGHTSMSNNLKKVQHYEDNISWTKMQRVAAESLGLSSEWIDYYDYRIIYSLLQTLVIAARNGEKHVYKEYQKEYKERSKRKNKYTNVILSNNHGTMKACVLTKVIPHNYLLARFVAKLAL